MCISITKILSKFYLTSFKFFKFTDTDHDGVLWNAWGSPSTGYNPWCLERVLDTVSRDLKVLTRTSWHGSRTCPTTLRLVSSGWWYRTIGHNTKTHLKINCFSIPGFDSLWVTTRVCKQNLFGTSNDRLYHRWSVYRNELKLILLHVNF